MARELDWLTTDSTIYVDGFCDFRVDMAGDEAVLRISAGSVQCHLVLGESVAERINLLLTEALADEDKKVPESCYMVVPIHPRTVPNPSNSGGNSALAVIEAAIR